MEIDAQKLINKLLAKITQLEYENAQLSVLVETHEQGEKDELRKANLE